MRKTLLLTTLLLVVPVVPVLAVPPVLSGLLQRKPVTGGGGGPPSANLVEHLKADVLSQGDGTTVGTWTATVGKNATQATEGNKPTYETNEKNSLPVIRFDGTDNWMDTAAFNSALTPPFCVFLVYQIRNTGNSRPLDDISTRGCHLRILCDNTPGDGDVTIYAGGGFVTTYENNAEDTWFILSLEMNAASSKWRVNGGTETAFDSSPGTDNLSGLTLGVAIDHSTEFSPVDFAEILVYSGAMADKTAVFSYLNTKWAVY